MTDYKEWFSRPRACRGSYSGDFVAGWDAAQGLDGLPGLCSASANKLYALVSKVHGCFWVDGFCAAIDHSRGCDTSGVVAARYLGLLSGRPRC